MTLAGSLRQVSTPTKAVAIAVAVAVVGALLTLPSVIEAPPSAGVPNCNPSGSGSGTLTDPYLVATRAQLEAIDDDPSCLSANYVQTGNIALTGSAWTRSRASSPAGTTEAAMPSMA